MEITFAESFEKDYQDKFHIAPSHIRALIERSDRIKIMKEDGLQINIYLSKLINDKFYLLVIAYESKVIRVESAYKILKDLVEQDEEDPWLVLQKFIWKFGLTIKFDNQLTKLIYKESLTFEGNFVEKKDLFQWLNPQNHAMSGGGNIKIDNSQNGKTLAKCFLVYFIDIDRYKSWLRDNLDEDSEDIANILEGKLNSCKPGNESWHEYENLCIEIIEYLFRDSFREFTSKIQPRTSDDLERRDLIVANDVKDGVSFWADIKTEFNSNHIIFEFKNINKELGKDEVYQADDYTNIALGRFAIIFSRKGLSNSGQEAVKRKYSDGDKKLILNCTDIDIKEMLSLRKQGKDPTNVLRSKKAEFELAF